MVEAIKGLKSKNAHMDRTPEFLSSFNAGRDALTNAVMLHHPEPNAEIAILVDASQYAVRGLVPCVPALKLLKKDLTKKW
ncbi:hypothetical protein TCAL_15702 [Tigriopus californicus]|uniref:Reverse transcriptase/retrotransposon-derived protein RNase H-like domain-containing protein n=1 Tax=Tigriopus californicus TaxID=6832 RepID=A0A553P6W0_TIGCA|nr:hypothetical protein TCAL_15702 [Tigriopus californicus]